MTTGAPAETKPSAWPKLWQFTLLGLPLLALAALVLSLWFRKPDYMAVLWRDPMGVRMLTGSVGLLLVGAGLYLGGCALLNRFTARSRWGKGATVAQIGLVAAWVVVFCAPVAFVCLIGPAAIQIQNSLLSKG
ncbi:hypothetical protein J8F10_37350 [Gemmata sp. G18]|uniref:Uncharacterized protein n=1 Tax=Gemmata palustris TaxID=2822762 RepID=A0ABS5C4K6_9BACT|nr:hypothetical protein [Gemmata palustris]MBP3960923.1 hypothetical protein [Gemmata palustris]